MSKPPRRLTFEVVKKSSEYHRNPASNLELKVLSRDPFHVSNKGWLSERYGKGYQSLTFKLSQLSTLKRMRIVSHEHCISKKIEVSIGVGNNSSSATYRVAGHIFFSSNRQTGWKAREEKVVSMDDATANFVKLRLFECHPVKQNTYGQIGIVLIELEGIKGGGTDAMETVKDYPPEVREKARDKVGGAHMWQRMSWEERLEVIENLPKEVEADDNENLPRIFAEAGIDWGKHGFSTSLGGGLGLGNTGSGNGHGDTSNGRTSPQTTMGAEEFPTLPGMMSEVDQVLHGLGLPLELIRQPNMSNPTMDYTTTRLLEVLDREKDTAVQKEEFDQALELSETMKVLVSIGSEMQALKKAKEFAVLTGDYKAAADAKRKMGQLDARRMVIGTQSPERQAALAPPPTWEDEERARARSASAANAAKARKQPRNLSRRKPSRPSPRNSKPLVSQQEKPIQSSRTKEQPIHGTGAISGSRPSSGKPRGPPPRGAPPRGIPSSKSQNPSSPILPTTNEKAEKRVDQSNGKLMTKKGFINMYGPDGELKWNQAMTVEQLAGAETGGLDDFHVEDDDHHGDPFGDSHQDAAALTEECETMSLETPALEAVRVELRKMDLVKYLKKMMTEMVRSVKDLQKLNAQDVNAFGFTEKESVQFFKWKRAYADGESQRIREAETLKLIMLRKKKIKMQREAREKKDKKIKELEEKVKQEKMTKEDEKTKQLLHDDETIPPESTETDTDTATEEKEKEEAATKLQAITRGNSSRKETDLQKKTKETEAADEEKEAATKLQAITRGNSARKDVEQKKTEQKEEEEKEEEQAPSTNEDKLDRSLHPADAKHQAPPNQNHNPALKKHLEEWIKKKTNPEESLTIPDAINGPARSDLLRAIRLYGDDLVACLMAKKWKLRECALVVALEELYNVTKTYAPLNNIDNKVNVTCEMVAYGALSDTLMGVFSAATALTIEVFSAKFCEGMIPADIDAGLEHCIPYLVKRSGDDKAPIRDNAFKTFTTLLNQPHVSINTISKIVMGEHKNLPAAPRSQVGFLNIICAIVPISGLKGEGNPLTLRNAIKVANVSITDQRIEVRQAAGELICQIWETWNKNIECEKYLTKANLDTINKVGAALLDKANKSIVPEKQASEWVWVNKKLIAHITKLKSTTSGGKEAARLAKNKHMASEAKAITASRRFGTAGKNKGKGKGKGKGKAPVNTKAKGAKVTKDLKGTKGVKEPIDKAKPAGKKVSDKPKTADGGKKKTKEVKKKKKPAPPTDEVKKTPTPAPSKDKPLDKSTDKDKDKKSPVATKAKGKSDALKNAKSKIKKGITKHQIIQKASGVKKKDCAIM